jgi:hypothetical protein
MTKPMVRIHDVSTNEIIDREMTDAEFAQYQADQAERQAKEAEQAAKNEAKAALLDYSDEASPMQGWATAKRTIR